MTKKEKIMKKVTGYLFIIYSTTSLINCLLQLFAFLFIDGTVSINNDGFVAFEQVTSPLMYIAFLLLGLTLIKEKSFNHSQPEIDSKIRNNQNESNSNDLPSTGLNILSFLIPLVGLIIYIIEKDKSPIKAKSAGKSALWGVGVSVILIIISVIVTMVMINRIY